MIPEGVKTAESEKKVIRELTDIHLRLFASIP